jgi:hypothetical protein
MVNPDGSAPVSAGELLRRTLRVDRPHRGYRPHAVLCRTLAEVHDEVAGLLGGPRRGLHRLYRGIASVHGIAALATADLLDGVPWERAAQGAIDVAWRGIAGPAAS